MRKSLLRREIHDYSCVKVPDSKIHKRTGYIKLNLNTVYGRILLVNIYRPDSDCDPQPTLDMLTAEADGDFAHILVHADFNSAAATNGYVRVTSHGAKYDT